MMLTALTSLQTLYMLAPQLALGPLTLLAPLTLIGLIVLPLIWWLLRVTPPKPRLQIFPPLRILSEVNNEDETPDSTPLWLLIFRLLLVSLIAFALARPFISQSDNSSDKPLTLVIDNGWDAAHIWPQMMKEAESRLSEARRSDLPVHIILSETPSSTDDPASTSAADAARYIKTLRPRSLPSDRTAARDQLSALDISGDDVVWLSSEISFNPQADQQLMDAMKPAGRVISLEPPSELPIIFPGELSESADGFRTVWHRTQTDSLLARDILALSADGAVLARQSVTFAPGESRSEAVLELPPQLRRKVSQLRADNIQSAGAVKLLDDSWGRPLIGLVTTGSQSGSPLLSEPFYAQKALQPFADIYEGGVDELLALGTNILIMPDSARTITPEVRDYVEKGGMLIRFAGPRLAKRPDDFLPVTLREGGRALGGALTWEEPQKIAPFRPESPFYGLTIPDDILIKRQVMAEPNTETDNRTWARLEDGAPIVTSAPQGAGRLVLFHVTAGPDWSNLPISGLYVEMLKRILPLAGTGPSKIERGAGDWAPDRVLSGYGRLVSPGPEVKPIANAEFDAAEISQAHPPGIYRQGPRRGALNTVTDPSKITPLALASGIKRVKYGETREQTLEGLLLGLAVLLLGLDAFFALLVSGRRSNIWTRLWPRSLRQRAKTAAAFVIGGLFLAGALNPPPAFAQSSPVSEDMRITDATSLHLAYVKTGKSGTDWLSEAAMRGLMTALTDRTTIEPDGVRGIDPETDALEFYPFIYWPVDRQSGGLSDKAAANLNQFMATGGTIIFDTQDAGDQALTAGQAHPGLKRVTEKLDIPNLVQVPEDHVLTKSFYLIDVFPGRWANGHVWVDRNVNGVARDGVSSVIIGSNDWAAAWAQDDNGGPVIATLENDIPRQREMAMRFGVNVAMYALAGNYKSDQVHSAALVERLGQRQKRYEIENLLDKQDGGD